jgi:hypothetical protein
MTEKYAKNRLLHCSECKHREMIIKLTDYQFKVNDNWTTLYYLKLICKNCNNKMAIRMLPNNQFEICEDEIFEKDILPIIEDNAKQYIKELNSIHEDVNDKIKTVDKILDKVKDE